jgi:hypothetical protein
MKLKTLVTKTERAGFDIAAMSINVKTGLFNINRHACDRIGLTDKSQVLILQDEDDPQNFYIEKVESGGQVVREKKPVTNGVLFNNRSLACQVAQGLKKELDGNRMRILIAGEATELDDRKLFGLL